MFTEIARTDPKYVKMAIFTQFHFVRRKFLQEVSWSPTAYAWMNIPTIIA